MHLFPQLNVEIYKAFNLYVFSMMIIRLMCILVISHIHEIRDNGKIHGSNWGKVRQYVLLHTFLMCTTAHCMQRQISSLFISWPTN